MEAKTPRAASEPLKYQTWFLKVSIHCEGCRRKVKKVLRNIDGVFTTTIDPQQQKVTVTGSVGVETLIRKLIKAGKHAEIWPENGAGKDGKPKKRNEQQREAEGVENHHRSPANAESNSVSAKNRGIENADNSSNNNKKTSESKTGGKKSPEKSSGGGASPPEQEKKGKKGGGVEGEGEGEGEGDSVKKNKKKKKKVQSSGIEKNGSSSASSSGAGAHSGSGEGMGQMNLSPTRQQEWAYAYPESESYYYPGAGPLVYLATYNRFCPMAMHGKMGGGPSYYVSPLPYISAGLDHDPYHFQSPPLVPFEIFSDDNANACSLM
ncbi:hypothetical protein HN51_063770 [Arachis hypogaea]|uniref:HMA domain-containing protein n=1 Tax=Arachis hypogaea TaxID=3818 RepID=A0A445AWY1_ARAHY|nr:heavy metal-associated isoprenylated plant protein 36 [Arachis hypogaea]QHO21370.1 uncharacterized protein DS421_11g346070 [Arachis hypogaea]RYR30903.1 hypothetical protein Ahy_B01g055693 [Arachis hypogaea]